MRQMGQPFKIQIEKQVEEEMASTVIESSYTPADTSVTPGESHGEDAQLQMADHDQDAAQAQAEAHRKSLAQAKVDAAKLAAQAKVAAIKVCVFFALVRSCVGGRPLIKEHVCMFAGVMHALGPTGGREQRG